MDLQN